MTAGPPHDFVDAKQLGIEKCTSSGRPPGDCQFTHLALTDPDERELRNLIAAAHHRQRREALEAERSGKVTGGVWGFVSYSYRVSFTRPGGASESLWLHTGEGAAWLDGRGLVDHVVFTAPESARLLSILARAVPRIMPPTHSEIRSRLRSGASGT